MHLARTALMSLGLGLGAPAIAAAATVSVETLVHETTTTVEITLDDSTVLCSSAEYGQEFLKILIPELAKLTLLDHQNAGAGAPCVAAGVCAPGNAPSDILDPAQPKETVAIQVTAVRLDESDADAQLCDTYLIERVKIDVRGVEFTHERGIALGSRPFADCATTQAASDDPLGGDDGEDGEDDADGDASRPAADEGGCSAVPQAGSVAMLGVASVLALRGRRRLRLPLRR